MIGFKPPLRSMINRNTTAYFDVRNSIFYILNSNISVVIRYI